MKKLIEIFIVLAFSLSALTAQAIEVLPDEPELCTLEEALDAPELVWETGGDADWFCQSDVYYYGGSSAQSGMIEDNGTSWLETTVTVSDLKIISFYWKLQPPPQSVPLSVPEEGSCASRKGSMSFYINGSEDRSKDRERNWQHERLYLLPGTYTLRWEYTKGEGDGPDLETPDGDCSPRIGLVDKVEIADMPSVKLLKYYADTYKEPCSPEPLFVKNRVAKADADECYDHGSVGVPEGDNCTEGDPKVNQAYIWGLARSGNLWFGTVANTQCLVMAALSMGGSLPVLETENFVCEFSEADNELGALGDWRPPQIFEYDPATMAVTERTPIDLLENPTLGIRSAGALDGVVLLAGPALDQEAVNVFAFLDNGTYLGMDVLSDYNDIRQWVVHDGIMYTGVRTTEDGEGRILRWTGDRDAPFQFEVVGIIDLSAANMAVHRDRLFVTTWPAFSFSIDLREMGLWMSPQISEGVGLTSSDNESWEKVWTVSDYEPDPIVRRVYGGGALASIDGTLFWGTMHVPFSGTAAALAAEQAELIDLGGADYEIGPEDMVATALGTHRATSVFSSTFETSQSTIELLYGDEYLPVYDNETRSYTIAEDEMHRNRMDNSTGIEGSSVPKWGPSGICSFFNAYTWSMQRGFADYPNRGGLLLGTFDWSFVARDTAGVMLADFLPDDAGPVLDIILNVIDELRNQCSSYGADLYVIRSADEPFILESTNGAGNYLNYGIRTMLMTDATEVPDDVDGPAVIGEDECPQGYLGMANSFNLAEEGGWELISMYPLPELVLLSPTPEQIVVGDLTLQAQDLSACPLENVEFVVKKIHVEESSIYPAVNSGAGLWESAVLDTTQMPIGVYFAKARGSDADGVMAESSWEVFVITYDCTEGSECDDNLFCTGVETCDGGLCVEGENPCGELACVEDNGTCTDDCTEDSECDDNLFCTGVETCDGGLCVEGENPCGELPCVEDSGTCIDNCTEDSECDDNLFCTGVETCDGGFCVEGENPCGELPCVEDSGTCTEPAAICELTAGVGKKQRPSLSHPSKDKKSTLYITDLEGFNINGNLDLGPFGFNKAKVKFKKSVLKVRITVPAGLASGDYEIMIGGCVGMVKVLNKEELKAWKKIAKAAAKAAKK